MTTAIPARAHAMAQFSQGGAHGVIDAAGTRISLVEVLAFFDPQWPVLKSRVAQSDQNGTRSNIAFNSTPGSWGDDPMQVMLLNPARPTILMSTSSLTSPEV